MENHKDDILKKFLQDTFSDYEPEPSGAAWENIFAAIQPSKPSFWSKTKSWLTSTVVILMATLLSYNLGETKAKHTEMTLHDSKLQSDQLQMKKISANKQAKTLNIQSENIVESDTPKVIERKHSIVGIQSKENVVTPNVNLTASTDYLPTVNVETPTVNIESGRVKALITDESVRANTLATDKEDADINQIVEKRLNEVAMSKDENLTTSTIERVPSVRVATLTTEKNGGDETLATEKNTTIEQVRNISPMESLKNKDLVLTKITLNFPKIKPVTMPKREVKPVRRPTYLSMSITPIQTYRILTIQDQNVQKVQTNGLFDSERNGWQFDVGITKPIGKLWNFRTSFTYLEMSQWSEYKVSTDELILKNDNVSNGNNKSSQNSRTDLDVVGQTVTESKTLQMIGLKMDVQKFVKITTKNRYFLSAGTQMMYESSQKQGNLFLNISGGFQHVISNHAFLTIEPTASYSLTNLNDSGSLLQANGYNLGVKMGVSFRIK